VTRSFPGGSDAGWVRRIEVDKRKLQRLEQALKEEYENLVKALGRNRAAEEEILLEKTEDEGDLALISHNKELLYNLHESDFRRLKAIEDALKRIHREEYGVCSQCGEDINEKRLVAVPWARMCLRCQEETEREDAESAFAGASRHRDPE
jgi:DnaK suppressor protein